MKCHTFAARGPREAGGCAVADEPVPALRAQTSVHARLRVTLW
jgi:hypothetical protein